MCKKLTALLLCAVMAFTPLMAGFATDDGVLSDESEPIVEIVETAPVVEEPEVEPDPPPVVIESKEPEEKPMVLLSFGDMQPMAAGDGDVVTFNPTSLTFVVGGPSQTLEASYDGAETNVTLTAETTDTNILIASVPGGSPLSITVTAVTAGTATITVTATDNDNGGAVLARETCTVTVREYIYADGIELSDDTMTLYIGADAVDLPTVSLTPVPNDDTLGIVTWAVTSGTVGAVDIIGTTVKATNSATAEEIVVVTATANGFTANCEITIAYAPLAAITLPGTGTVRIGDTMPPLTFSYSPSYAQAPTGLVWTSSDPDVATVDSTTGIVEGVALGETTITVTTAEGITSNGCVVTVRAPLATGIALTPERMTLNMSEPEGQRLPTVSLVPAINDDDIDNYDIEWSVPLADVDKIVIDDVEGTVSIGTGGSAQDSVTLTATATPKSGSNATALTADTADCVITIAAFPLTAIELDNELEVFLGTPETLICTLPGDYSDTPLLTWNSDNEDVATVVTGEVTGVKPGTATITATAKGAGTGGTDVTSNPCVVTVKAVSATSITVTPPSLPLKVGDVATGKGTVAVTFEPAGCTADTVGFKLDAEAAAKISVAPDPDNANVLIVTALAGSDTAVTFNVFSNEDATLTPVPVSVTIEEDATAITLDETEMTLYKSAGGPGTTGILSASFLPETATTAHSDIQWYSDNTAVATVVNGVVTPAGSGTANIYAYLSNSDFTNATIKSDPCEVTVYIPVNGITIIEKDDPLKIPLDSVMLAVDVSGHDTVQLDVVLDPTDANEPYEWVSSEPAVAKVDGDGVVTAVSHGVADITVEVKSANGVFTTCTITVIVSAAKITLAPSHMQLNKGASDTFEAFCQPVFTTVDELTWTSDNPAVATVDSTGEVTAMDCGTATITATSINGKIEATAKVTVGIWADENLVLESISKKWSALTTDADKEVSLYPVEPSTFWPTGCTDKLIDWSSSDPTVASVDQTGMVTLKRIGEAEIRTVLERTGEELYCYVLVYDDATKISLPDEWEADLWPNDTWQSYYNDFILPIAFEPDNANDIRVKWEIDGGSFSCSALDIDEDTGVITPKASTTFTGPVKVHAYIDTTGTTTYATAAAELKAECLVTIKQRSGITIEVPAGFTGFVAKGDKIQLNAKWTETIHDEGSDKPNVTWYSFDTSLAKVDNKTKKGLVTIAATGTAKKPGVWVEAYTADDVWAEVYMEPVLDATAIKLNSGKDVKINLSAGKAVSVKYAVTPSTAFGVERVGFDLYSADSAIDVDDIVTAELNTLTKSIKLTPMAPGEVELRVWWNPNPAGGPTTYGAATVKASIKVTVSNPATSIKLGSSDPAKVQYGMIVLDTSDATLPNIVATLTGKASADCNDTIKWASSDKKVVAVEALATDPTGKTAALTFGAQKKLGKAVITATTGSGKKATYTVLVTDNNLTAKKMTLSSTKATLAIGQELQLVPNFTPVGSLAAVAWASSDTSVATVSDGLVTAVKDGTTNITATAAGISKPVTCKITVSTKSTSAVFPNGGKLTMLAGTEIKATITISPALDVSNEKLVWSSSNKAVTVAWDAQNPTTVTIKSTGTTATKATITAKTTNTAGKQVKKFTCTVQVYQPTSALTLMQGKKEVSEVRLALGKSISLKATRLPNTKSTEPIVWESEDASKLTSNGKGTFKAVAAFESLTVTASTTLGGAQETCVISQYVPAKKITMYDKKMNALAGSHVYLWAYTNQEYDGTVDYERRDQITWSSSNTAYATVDQNGMVTIKGTAPLNKKVTITAKTESGKKATCVITIK